MATKEEQLKKRQEETVGETVRKAQEVLKAGGTEPVKVDLRPEVAGVTRGQLGRRLPGESIEDLAQRFTPVTTPGVTPTPTDTPTTSTDAITVGVSEPKTPEDKAKELGIDVGERPTPPSGLITPDDLERAGLAKAEVAKINTELETILESRLELEAEFRATKARAAAGVTEAGRLAKVTEKGREVQEELDALNRRELVLETKLSNRNKTINEVAKWMQQDFINATNTFNTQFSQALQLYNLFDSEEDELKKDAKANLTALSNTIQEEIDAGTKTFEDMPPSMKRRLEELDVQAGFEPGTTLDYLQAFEKGEKELYKSTDAAGNIYLTSIKRDRTHNTQIITKGAAPKAPKEKKPVVPKIFGLTEDESAELLLDEPPQWFINQGQKSLQASISSERLVNLWSEYKSDQFERHRTITGELKEEEGGDLF